MDFNFRKKPVPSGPQPAPEQSAYEQAVRSDLKPELVESVPVKQQNDVTDSSDNSGDNPIQETAGRLPGSEAEMDKILEDVNQKVKSAAAEVKPKKSRLAFFKKKPKVPKTEEAVRSAPPTKSHRSLPLAITVVAVLAGLALSAAAFYAFSQESPNQPASTPSVRDPESANTSVTSEDIDSLSADLQSQIDSLNSASDFDSAALSDSTLGL